MDPEYILQADAFSIPELRTCRRWSIYIPFALTHVRDASCKTTRPIHRLVFGRTGVVSPDQIIDTCALAGDDEAQRNNNEQ